MSIVAMQERGTSEMKEMITRGKMAKITGDRTDRAHYIKRVVEYR